MCEQNEWVPDVSVLLLYFAVQNVYGGAWCAMGEENQAKNLRNKSTKNRMEGNKMVDWMQLETVKQIGYDNDGGDFDDDYVVS